MKIECRVPYPLGATLTDWGVCFGVAVPEGVECKLLLYSRKGKILKRTILFPKENRVGEICSLFVPLSKPENYCYLFEIGGKKMTDPYGRMFEGHESWGEPEDINSPRYAVLTLPDFDWGEDERPRHKPENTIIYRIHPRGFTRHPSSGVRHKGTFEGIREKIPYLKELGITALELMPVMEFEEVMGEEREGQKEPLKVPDGRLNYWGYGDTWLMAPKTSYASDTKDPVGELKNLVKALHRANIEVIFEVYLREGISTSYVLDVLRYWYLEYHADGFKLTGDVPKRAVAQDPMLKSAKLFSWDWDGAGAASGRGHLACCNDGFMTDMRRFLKGDEDCLRQFVFRMQENPQQTGTVHYMAYTNGFTLMDAVSYDQKHNEPNGENNRDGSDYNYSWNCGAEGPTRKKKVLSLRKRQIRNALTFLFLSQGMPLLMAGDEMGHTKKGNNNSYCQDNDISWVNWNLLKTNHEIYDFTRFLISFRKAHRVFAMPEAFCNADVTGRGIPDLSVHGVRPWYPEYENFRRQIGLLYDGRYADPRREDGAFYILCNMHWEAHEFFLPSPAVAWDKEGKRKQEKVRPSWHKVFDTAAEDPESFSESGHEDKLQDQRRVTLSPRSILVLTEKGE